MSTKDKAIEQLTGNAQIISWIGLGKDEDGKQVDISAALFKTVQFNGNYGGASVQLEGSIDGTNFHVLTDPQGNALRKSNNAIEYVMENVRWIRPAVQGGNSDTKIDVLLFHKFER